MRLEAPVPADAGAIAGVVTAAESLLYDRSTFSQADLEAEWSEIDPRRDAHVVRDGDRVLGYGVVRERTRERWVVEGYVHPDERGRGIGGAIAARLETEAVQGGARSIQNAILERDTGAAGLLEDMGYGLARVFRELRIGLEEPPVPPAWPGTLRVTPFDPERDAAAFHAAYEEAFADSWDHTHRDLASWSKAHLESERFDPALWCVVQDGDDIAAGTISTMGSYGGGWVHVLFTRRPWRGRGIGAALLADAFVRLWERGERSIGLSVDSASITGAFRLYERAGMTPVMGWAVYEKALSAAD